MNNIMLWSVFTLVIVTMLLLDLGIFHKKAHSVNFKESLIWTIVWITLAMLFGVGIYFFYGHQKALEYVTGYLLEKSLSVDNIFVFVMIFTYFKVPKIYQHKVLFWGVLSAVILRGIFIAAGIALIEQFSVVIYIFGAFLIFTGIKMFFKKDDDIHPENNPVLKMVKKLFRITHEYEEGNFFTRKKGLLYATPLFVVLIFVEMSDILFAVDSIPAVLGITTDPLVVFTSNIFAILGLRSLYFMVSGVMDLFHFLHYGLAVVLAFVGMKMVIADYYHISILVSLSFILCTIIVSIILSLLIKKSKI